MVVRLSRLVLFVLATSCAAFANAEPPEEASNELRGASRLFALPSGSVSVEEVLRFVEEEEEALRFTDAEPERWLLETALISTGPEPESVVSVLKFLVGKKDDSCCLLVRDAREAPVSFARNEQGFRLDSSGKWLRVSHAPWRFINNAGKFQFKNVSDLALGKSHEVQIDLSDFLSAGLRKQIKRAVWDARTRCLYLHHSDNPLVAIRLRSPDDQLRHRSVWGQIVISNGLNSVVFSGFALRQADFCPSAASIEKIGTAVAAEEGDVVQMDWKEIRTTTLEQDAAALAMEATLASEAYRNPEIAAAREGIQAANRAALAYETDQHDPLRDFVPVDPADAERLSDAERRKDVENRLRTTIFEAEVELGIPEVTALAPVLTKTLVDLADAMANDLEGYPDDPSLLSREAQARYGAMRLHHFLRSVRLILITCDAPSLRPLRASLCDALFDLGESTSAMFQVEWKKLREDPFFDALLRAHRLELIEEKHREACVAELGAAEAGSTLENLAVEVLLRIDERPPEENGAAVDRWWRSEVVEANRGRRLRSLVVLSGCAFGRETILKRLRAEELPEDVRRDATRALTSRIDAAEQTGRDESIDAAQREAWRKELAELDIPASDDAAMAVPKS